MISQLINSNGNAVKNQFVITEDNIIKFQSYNTLVAVIDNDNNTTTLDHKWYYSQTTLKHLKLFLNISDSKKVIQGRIDTGVYLLKDLN